MFCSFGRQVKSLAAAIVCWMLGTIVAVSSLAAESPDWKYVTGEAVGVAVVYPKRVLESKSLDLLPRELAQSYSQTELGVELTDVERVVAVIEVPLAEGALPGALVFYFSKPQDFEGFMPKIRAGLKQGELEGLPYLEPNSAEAPGILKIDETTFALGNETMLRNMLRKEQADSPLRALLAKVKPDGECYAYISMDAARPAVDELLADAALPDELKYLRAFPEHLSAIHIRLDTAKQLAAEINLLAKDEAAAAKLVEIIEREIDSSFAEVKANAIEDLRLYDPKLESPVTRAALAYHERMLAEWREQYRPRRKGRVVSFLYPLPAVAQDANTPPRDPKPLDVQFVTEEAVGAAVVHPARLMASESLKRAPLEVLQAIAQDFGIDLTQVETVTLMFEIPTDDEPPVGAVIRFNRPQDLEFLLRGWQGAAVLNGKPYYRHEFGALPGIVPIDAQTLLVGQEEMLRRMMKKQKVESPLRATLANADDRFEAAAYVSVAALRPLVGLALQQVPLTDVVEPFRESARAVSSLQLEITTQDRLRAKLSAVSDTEEQAAEAEKRLGQAFDICVDYAVAFIKLGLRHESPLEEPHLAAAFAYLDRMADEGKKLRVSQREGNRISVTLLERDEINASEMMIFWAGVVPLVQAIQEW